MQVVIRTDASSIIGTGHVMRCLALAEELKRRKVLVNFICRAHPGNMIHLIKEKGYPVHVLPDIETSSRITSPSPQYNHFLGCHWKIDSQQTKEIIVKQYGKVDWIVADHYALDKRWEQTTSSYSKKIMVIDDLANRLHDCDALLDQNLHLDDKEYEGLVPPNCSKFLGPQYALLRPDFAHKRKLLAKKTGKINRILVFFGGIDRSNQTTKALNALNLLNCSNIRIDVVIGDQNPHRHQIESIIQSTNQARLYVQVNIVAELMAKAHLAIGGGGTAIWERCVVGLPAIVIALSLNQIKVVQIMHSIGAIHYLGQHTEVTTSQITLAIKQFLDSPQRVKDIGEQCLGITDGQGCNRVVNAMIRVK